MQQAAPDSSGDATPVGLSLGNLSLNLSGPGVWVADEYVKLTHYEARLLRLFVEQANHVLSYAFLTAALWNESGQPQIRHLNVLIHRLRAKLARSHPYSIETVRGRGYGLIRSTYAG